MKSHCQWNTTSQTQRISGVCITNMYCMYSMYGLFDANVNVFEESHSDGVVERMNLIEGVRKNIIKKRQK